MNTDGPEVPFPYSEMMAINVAKDIAEIADRAVRHVGQLDPFRQEAEARVDRFVHDLQKCRSAVQTMHCERLAKELVEGRYRAAANGTAVYRAALVRLIGMD